MSRIERTREEYRIKEENQKKESMGRVECGREVNE